MTVNTTTSEIEYTGNGVSTVFPVPFLFPANGDLVVIRIDAAGNSTTLVLGTDYTVSGAGNAAGGSVTLTVPLAVGALLSISRNLDVVQETDLRNQGKFYQQTIEDSFDYLTMLIQQAFSWLGRALVRPIGKNYYDAEGRQIANVGDPLVGGDAVNRNWVSTFVGNLLSQIQGPINNAANIFYQAHDGTSHVVQDISGNEGGYLVGLIQTGTGAVYDTALAEYRRTIRPEQFGAVGNGIADDTLALQRALDRGVGQVVTLRPGAIYGISAALQIDSGTTLVAYGAQIKRLAFIDNMIRNKSNGTVGGWSANTNITLLGGHWRSDDAFGQQLTLIGFSHCTGIILRDVQTTHNGSWHHVELNSTRQATVENCVFNGGYAANLSTNEAVQIDANIDGSQWPWFGPADSTQCYEIIIRGCTFNSNGTGIGTHSGVANMRHSNILIEGNTFVKPLYVGVHARSWSGVKIVDNRFEGGYWGVYHEYNDSNVTNDWLIEGNTFFQQGDTDWPGGDGRAIVIDGTASTYLRNYRIVNNAVLSINLASKSRHGISVNYTHQGVISGNTLDSINRTGIYVYGGDRINVNNNMLINCNQEGLTGAVAGIVLGNTGGVDTNRLTVVGNTTDTLYMTGTIRSVVRQNQVTTASGLTQAGTNTNANVGNNLVDTTFT